MKQPIGPKLEDHLSNSIPKMMIELHFFGSQSVVNNYVKPTLNEGKSVKINRNIKDMRDNYIPRKRDTTDYDSYIQSIDITQYCTGILINDSISAPYNAMNLQLELPKGLQHYIFHGQANNMYGDNEKYGYEVFRNLKAGGWITAKIQDNAFNDDKDEGYYTVFMGKIDNINYGLVGGEMGGGYQTSVNVSCSSFIQPLINSQFKVDTSPEKRTAITTNSLLTVEEYINNIVDPISSLATEPQNLGEIFYKFFRFFAQMPIPHSMVRGSDPIAVGGLINPLGQNVLVAYDPSILANTVFSGSGSKLPKVSTPRAIASAINKSSIWKFLLGTFSPDPMIFECFTTMLRPIGDDKKSREEGLRGILSGIDEAGQPRSKEGLLNKATGFDISQDYIGSLQKQAVKDAWSSLGAIPTIIFRLKPLRPHDHIVVSYILKYYRNSIKGNLSSLGEKYTETYAEKFDKKNPDSNLSIATPSSSAMVIPRERITSITFNYSESNKFNAVYVDDITTAGNQSRINRQAANTLVPTPVYDVDDINMNGLRVYDVSFPFTTITGEEGSPNDLTSALAERAFTLSANDNEYCSGSINLAYYPQNYISQGTWGVVLMNDEKRGAFERSEYLEEGGTNNITTDLKWFVFYIESVSKTFSVDQNTGVVEGTISINYSRGAFGEKRSIFLPGRN